MTRRSRTLPGRKGRRTPKEAQKRTALIMRARCPRSHEWRNDD